MVQNNEVQDTVEEVTDTVEEVTEVEETTTTEVTKGRGRPAGSTSKVNDEVLELRKEVQDLKNKITALDSDTSRLSEANAENRLNAAIEKLGLRTSVIQQWVEMFHMFLTTSRITNSADRVAEDELTIVISKLPEQNHPLFIGVHAEADN